MKSIEYKIGSDISKEHLYALYEDAGWISYTNDMEKLIKALSHSLMVVSAWSQGELVGLIRVVGDGFVILYIQDILVLRNFKRFGIGSGLMNTVLDEFKDVRQKVLLTEDSLETRGFYESFGFKSCDDGMTVAFAIQR